MGGLGRGTLGKSIYYLCPGNVGWSTTTPARCEDTADAALAPGLQPEAGQLPECDREDLTIAMKGFAKFRIHGLGWQVIFDGILHGAVGCCWDLVLCTLSANLRRVSKPRSTCV